MNFSCDRCGRLYSIADEKVQGRAFRVKCKACEHTIVVKATVPAAVQAPRGPVLTPPLRAPAPVPPAAPAATRPAAPAAPPPLPARASQDASLAELFGDGSGGAGAVTAPTARAPVPSPAASTALSGAEEAWLSGGGTADAAPPDVAPPDVDGAPAPTPRRRRALVAFGAVAGLAVCVAAALLLGTGRRKAAPRPAPQPVAVAPEPAPAPAAAPSPTVEPAPAAETATAADASPPPTAGPTRASAGLQPGAMGAGGRDRRRNLQIASKDRKLLDLLERKEDATPAAAIAKTSLDTGRAVLDRASVEQALADNRAAFGACVTKAVKANPRLKVDDKKATLMLTVQPTGVVSACWIAEAELEKTSLGRCLVAASRRVVFPAFQGEALDVSAPLALSAVR